MPRWAGKVGYKMVVEKDPENHPGVWSNQIEEHQYFGDKLQDYVKQRSYSRVVDDIDMSTIISFVGDPFAYKNYMHIVYVEVNGAKWRVINVDANSPPRLRLTIGGLYNAATNGVS